MNCWNSPSGTKQLDKNWEQDSWDKIPDNISPCWDVELRMRVLNLLYHHTQLQK